MKQKLTIKDLEKEVDDLLTIDELSKITKLSKTFLRRASSQLGLPRYKIGGSVRYKVEDFLKWVEQRKVS